MRTEHVAMGMEKRLTYSFFLKYVGWGAATALQELFSELGIQWQVRLSLFPNETFVVVRKTENKFAIS